VKLHTKIAIGLVLGAVLGGGLQAVFADAAWLIWVSENIAWPLGQAWLRFLLMTVVPIVLASITLGVAGIGDIRKVGRLGGRTMGYFGLSTLISAAIGLTLVNVLQPGGGVEQATQEALMATYGAQASGMTAGGAGGFGVSTFVNIIPTNPVGAAANMDMLALIFFSLVFGAALTVLPAKTAQPVVDVLQGIGDAVIEIIGWAMALAPYGVFFLIFQMTSRFGFGLLVQLGMYVLVVVLGLLLHATVGISALVKIFARVNPMRFWKGAQDVIITAFSTSSSMATLPTNIATAENEFGVSPKIAGFVLPLGATMNMNGTALFEGVTVLFLAQVFGVDLNLGMQIVVIVLSVLTAIGAAGVPGGSLPLMMVVMGTVGVPPEGIAIILGVDRVLDMCRTTLNVSGDLSATLYIDRVDREMGEPAPALATAAGGAGSA
jgi:dicarboxylate/amino acid:cation (Na+ or H+) symporter, DAACS family